MAEYQSSDPVDAVIMWVDGSDPAHAEKLNIYLGCKGLARLGAASKARFNHAGELDYCVTSLLKFAPWLRTIFIVTDNQRPELLGKLEGTLFAGRVKLIDHKIIFAGYENYLPSFNSMAISSLLWRIPDIAENFIYFNDDFMLIRPVFPVDFFRDKHVVLRGKWHKLPESVCGARLIGWFKRKLRPKEKGRISFWGLQQSCARLLGFNTSYFRLPHVPHAWKKSSWERLFTEVPDALQFNISAQLRSCNQFVPESLFAHFSYRNEIAVIDNHRTNIQLKPTAQSLWRIKWKLNRAKYKEHIVFTCVQSIEMANPIKQKLIFDWLDETIGRLEDLSVSKT
ncbi:MAG: capsular biosynthesis protein [Gammaproteobacteria bacterium]|nr:MAG: capsular biosynthesis protein [Gammaproteobacteria bacterium]